MNDKGYAHPLYSLDLLRGASARGDGARYSVPVPEGRVTVAQPLRHLGVRCGVGACEEAVAEALARLRLAPAALGDFGFDEAWRASLLHWRGRLLALDSEQRARRGAPGAGTSRAQVEAGRALLGRLSLSARLSGLQGAFVSGAAPWRAAELAAALAAAAERARAHDEALGRCGFSAAHREEMERLAEALRAHGAARPARRLEQAQGQAQLVVLRAAIRGDARRLREAARLLRLA